MENVKNIKLLKTFIKYVFFAFLMLIMNMATLNNNLQPFGFAVYFALVWCNQNIFLVSFIYIITALTFGITEISLVCTLFTVGIFLLCYFLHYKLQKPLNITLILTYSFLSQLAFMYFNLDSVDGLFYCLAYLMIGILFTLITLITFQSFLKKKLVNFALEENISLCIFIAVLSLGLINIELWHINALQIISLITLMLLNKVSKIKMLLCSIVLGLGVALSTFFVGYLYIFCSYAIIIWLFADKNPIFLTFGLLFVDLFIGLYLSVLPVYHFQSLIAILLSVSIFYILSKKYLNFALSYLSSSEKNLLAQNVVNANTKKLNRKLMEMAEIFSELQKLFNSMSNGNMAEEEVIDLITQEILQRTCQDCKDKNRCLRLNNKETMKLIKDLVFLGLRKGKLTLMDVDDRFSHTCIKVNMIIPEINQLINEYKEYENKLSHKDLSKITIARSLNGVSMVLLDLAEDLNKEIAFDTQLERDIQDELKYEGIECREILIYKKEMETTIILLIKNEHIFEKKLTSIISILVGMRMHIASVIASETPNYSSVVFKIAPKFDIIYGVANQKKAGSESSGDTHSFNRLQEDKFLFALCDGMGSGANAKRASEISIGIIENLYKAGFDSDNVIDCANNFLTMASTDIFTALDLGIIDLRNGICDFIKIGAPFGYIKHQESTDIIEAGALPMGILEELKPKTTKIVLEHGDNIILMTDGVLDAFDDEQILKNFINNIEIKNPQTMAEHILNEAVHLNNEAPNDDMTVFVVRILKQN